MNQVRRIKILDFFSKAVPGLLIVTVVMLVLPNFLDVPADILWIPVYVGVIIGYFEKRNAIEYWILPEYLDEARSAVQSVGFKHRCTDEGETLFELKPRWRFKYFATLKREENKYLLDVPEKFEARLDELITPNMLYGARRKKWYRNPVAKYSGDSAGVSVGAKAPDG